MRAGGSRRRSDRAAFVPTVQQPRDGAAVAHAVNLWTAATRRAVGSLPRPRCCAGDRELDARGVLRPARRWRRRSTSNASATPGACSAVASEKPRSSAREDAAHRRRPTGTRRTGPARSRHQQVAAVTGRGDAEVAPRGLAELGGTPVPAGACASAACIVVSSPPSAAPRDPDQQRPALGRGDRQRGRDRRRHRPFPHEVGERQRGHGVPSITRSPSRALPGRGRAMRHEDSVQGHARRGAATERGTDVGAPFTGIRLAGVCSDPVASCGRCGSGERQRVDVVPPPCGSIWSTPFQTASSKRYDCAGSNSR